MIAATLFLMLDAASLAAQQLQHGRNPLEILFTERRGQIEVGGPYIGVEFHDSRPLPSRISFYYPVANSIDLSVDYWRRRESMPMAVGIAINGGKKGWLGREGWDYVLSPHRVTFLRRVDELACTISYDFCLDEPAMVMRIALANSSNAPASVELYTHLKSTLRTCQTYARRDSAVVEFIPGFQGYRANFMEEDTHQASLIVHNVGARPAAWSANSRALRPTDDGLSTWTEHDFRFPINNLPTESRIPAFGAFEYQAVIHPGDSLVIVQLIGSYRTEEWEQRTSKLRSGWKREIGAYDAFIKTKAFGVASLATGDYAIDHSSTWARALLAANAHYLDGKIAPMPCPAEYNFFFTHDVLLTNLGTVHFDTARVKKDLLYLLEHAKDTIIPHAYYWRDDGYKTEYCTPDNWNHAWFILVVGTYLRHSLDGFLGYVLFPYVTKSLDALLTQRKQENLIHGRSPDWWDIGNNPGPRAYLTTLTIRALREYTSIASLIGNTSARCAEYEKLAENMQRALVEHLWNEQANYLLNYNSGIKDRHYYAGSLLSVVYGLLDSLRSTQLVESASRELLDQRLGIRTVSPPDFHTDSMRTFFKFVGNEAGDPFIYANGGVWPHMNAWYTHALVQTGHAQRALEFFKSTMTIEGIVQSPMGQPAMYEYRNANPASLAYGEVDKPSFLWAAGLYLSTVYLLCGVREDEWTISFSPLAFTPPPEGIQLSLTFGAMKDVRLRGRGDRLRSHTADGTKMPSLVLAQSQRNARYLEIEFGSVNGPYLERVNALLHSVEFDEANYALDFVVSSFEGHGVSATVVAPSVPTKITLNDAPLPLTRIEVADDGAVNVEVSFVGTNATQTVRIEF